MWTGSRAPLLTQLYGADSLRKAMGTASTLTGTSTSSLLFSDAKRYMDFLILEMWHISATERPLLIQET